MFEKIENSWKLAKECWRVLMLDKEMLMFPALSTLTTIVVFALIAYPFWVSGYFEQPEVVHIDPSQMFALSNLLKYALITIVPTYIVYVIITFFNSGLITCAFIRLCGDDPILADGFHVAWKRLPQIFTWSIIAATVGLLLRMLKGRNSLTRSILSGIAGLGWRVASFFVIPVIVAEEKGAIDALKRSGHLIKKNWGEALTLEVGLSILGIPAAIPAMALFLVAFETSQTSPIFGIILISIAVIYVFLVSLVFSTLDAIAKAALYMYASGDHMPENFNSEILETMFKRNNSTNPSFA